MSRFSILKEKKKEEFKRRKHINFKIKIEKKIDINLFIDFLNKDIRKRMYIDKKYENDFNECHLRHLNFICMETLLKEILLLYYKNYDELLSEDKDNSSIEELILYTPETTYKKDLTVISEGDIIKKYKLLNNNGEIKRISNEIYEKYKGFGFINLNFLKRQIYEYL